MIEFLQNIMKNND